MDILKSLEYLRNYVANYIDTSKKGEESDFGIRSLMTKVEYDYKYDLGLNPLNESVEDLVKAVKISYIDSREFIIEMSDRDYVSDVFLKENIDVDEYVSAITHYQRKFNQKLTDLSWKDGYEATHWVWALFVICRDNHILHNYEDLMTDTLIKVYNFFPPSDLKTEALCFISMIDVSLVKEQWIIDLEKTQLKDGTLMNKMPEDLLGDLEQDHKMYKVHQLCLGLIALYNYYNVIRIK